MKIAIISALSVIRWGGSESLWHGAAKHLAVRGHRVMVFTQRWSPAVSEVLELKSEGIQVSHFDMKGGVQRILNKLLNRWKIQFGPLKSLSRNLAKFGPDLVLVSNGDYKDGLPLIQAVAGIGVPYALLSQANSERLWPRDWEFHLLRYFYARARGVYCVSRSNLELLRKQTASALSHAKVVRNPFQVPFDQPFEWPSDQGGLHLACVARLDPLYKGQDLLIEALSEPVWRDRALEISFYGGGPALESLHALAGFFGVSDRVHFPGHVSDIPGLWKRHHALVLPSRQEGLPLALVEAMLCGRPGVVTPVAGNPEVIDEGVEGFICPDVTSRGMSLTLEKLWESKDKLEDMGRAAQARIRRDYPEDPCGAFASILEQLAASTPA